MTTQSGYVTPTEAAIVLGHSRNYLYALIATKRIKAVREGSEWRIPAEEITRRQQKRERARGRRGRRNVHTATN